MDRKTLRVDVPSSRPSSGNKESGASSSVEQGSSSTVTPAGSASDSSRIAQSNSSKSMQIMKGILQSPSALMSLGGLKKKSTTGHPQLSDSMHTRTSVDPYSRAAESVKYQSSIVQRESNTVEETSTGKDSKEDGFREIHFEPKESQNPNLEAFKRENNRVITSKYNIVTFLPIFLFEMFTRVAYLYFLIQAGLSWWSVVSPYSGIGATMALIFVLLVAGVKAVWEDVKRHREDELLNRSITHRLLQDGKIEDISWTDVKVGDAVMVKDDENFPADLLCIYSDLPDNVCFIKTTNLDGETNLKIRKPVDLKDGNEDMTVDDLLDLDLTLKAENPNSNLHSFKGSVTCRNHVYKDLNISGKRLDGDERNPSKPSINVPVTMNEMLLRGCTLKNSNFIVGLVVYAGKETRIQRNATKTPLKVGSFDRFLNLQISLVILLQLAMCVLLAVLNYVWMKDTGINHPYLALTFNVEGVYSNGFVQIVLNFFTFWILLSYLVPISLFVTLEIVKFWQGFIFINFDKMMRNPVTKEHAICRNSNLNEDLGRVEYIFSDKTGTLTSNEMQLRKISIKGDVFGDLSFKLEKNGDKTGLDALKFFDQRLCTAARVMKGLPLLGDAVSSGGSSKKVMAFHSSKPSVGTATALGLPHESLDLEKFKLDDDITPHDQGGHDVITPQSTLALGHHMTDFFSNLCLCHSLILENREGEDKPTYQGPSPDEVALVDAARQLGFEFKNRSQGNLTLNMLGKEVSYEILNVMEYSSDRGCMSVIARTPDNSIRLYCKGSDTKVMAKIREGTDQNLLKRTDHDLHTFAREGLRTLVLASKVIPESEYAEWDKRYQEASCLIEGRDDAINALGLEVEQDLELIGVTAIEDKLQDGVPAAIETLLDAGIRVWMITGDKQETAVNIAVSCNLVKDIESLMTINVGESEEPTQYASKLLDVAEHKIKEMYRREAQKCVEDVEQIPDSWQGGELTIDGPTLTFVLESKEMRLKIAKIVARCRGVVVSRSSPSQKAAVVQLMKEYEMDKAAGKSRGIVRWYKRYKRRLQGKMLSIGDGANDVAMIQTADVGIGIMGKEGRQATNSSDYAISQFRFLVPLLLIHGNLAYYRLSRLIKYSFYKNITFAFVMFFYQFYNGYSGQALVDSITAGMFNVVFTSLPILLFAVLDRPVGALSAFIRYPQLYDKRNNNSLSTLSFWKSGVMQGILHGAVNFFVPYYCVNTLGKHTITDVYSLGKVAFTSLLGSVTLEAALIARYWTWVFFWIVILSYFLVYPYFIVFPYIELGLKYYDPANVGTAEHVLATPLFWFVIIVCYAITFGSRLIEKTVQWAFYPHDDMILAEKEAIEERQGRTLLSDASGKSAFRLQVLTNRIGRIPSRFMQKQASTDSIHATSEELESQNTFTSGIGEEVSSQPGGDSSVREWDSLNSSKVPV